MQGLEPSPELVSVPVASGVLEVTAAAGVADVVAAGDSFETGCLLEAAAAVVVVVAVVGLEASEVKEPGAGAVLEGLAEQLKAVFASFAGQASAVVGTLEECSELEAEVGAGVVLGRVH